MHWFGKEPMSSEGGGVNILVIGQGGREHALVWKLRQSPRTNDIFCAPGNAGTGLEARNVNIAETDSAELVRLARKNRIELAIVGPEVPLCEGVADALRAADVAVFGPTKEAAELEGSKVFCKQLLQKAKVPTASFHVFEDYDQAISHILANQGPCVVKADGLAAGKGAIVCKNEQEAMAAATRILIDQEFGRAGDRIIIEERLAGPEVSVLALTDGTTIVPLPACQDHKAIFDNDEGPNTGGMGAYCPAPVLQEQQAQMVESDILVPVAHAMRQAKRRFQGVLYAGLMLTPGGPKVLEFNVRFGDPECQPLLMRLKSDLVDVLMATAMGKLAEIELEWDPRPAVCVVMASGGYPGSYKKGVPIRGLEEVAAMPDVKVFHAGTKVEGDRIVTNGGRVLGVTALGNDLASAQSRAYEAVQMIQFDGAQYRRDIAGKAIASV
jgi:phosphoribosylamine---glycine ligase